MVQLWVFRLVEFVCMQVTLTLNSTFQLPFSSAFPMAAPSLEIYVMMVWKHPFFILA